MTLATLPPSASTDLKTSPTTSPLAPQTHLSMRVSCAEVNQGDAATGPSFVAHQYAAYPFRLSGNLRLDPTDPQRVYAYIMNACPGILSGDDLRLALRLGQGASLYLTDQSATKVHSRPAGGPTAQFTWTMQVGAEAYLEYIPEPIILFPAAAITQRMQVTLHPQGRLVLSEIIVPGRLARGEIYAFDQFESRLRVQTPEGQLCFADNQRLLGRANPFQHSPFLTELPIIGNFILVVPGVDLSQLAQALQAYDLPSAGLRVGHSPLPGCNGLLVRAIASQISILKLYQHHAVNCVRQLTGQPPLPDIPK